MPLPLISARPPSAFLVELGAEISVASTAVPVRIINKPGGNTVPAVSEVMRAKPDGYTVLMDGPPQSSMLETVVRNLPFKTTDRTFVAITAYTPMKFVVPYESPFKTLKDAADALGLAITHAHAGAAMARIAQATGTARRTSGMYKAGRTY